MTRLMIGTIGSPGMLKGDYRRRRNLVEEVSRAGIDHLFVADHISFHNGLGMDGLVNAATLAAMNPELKIFLGVYLLALRHPVPVARQLSSLSQSAPGRIILGVGLGGEDRSELEICGVDPATRGRRTNECLKSLRVLMSGEPCTHQCEFFNFRDALIRPAPDPAIPIVIGGRSSAAIRRTGLYGDGWLGVWCSPRRFAEAVSQVAEVAECHGRSVKEWQHGLQIWVGFDANRSKAREILAREMETMYHLPFDAFEKYCPYGSPEEVAEYLVPYVRKGARVLNIKPCAVDDETEIEMVAEVCRLVKQETGVCNGSV